MSTSTRTHKANLHLAPQFQPDWRNRAWTGTYAATLCPFHEDESLDRQGLQEYVHKKYGAEEVGYGSIVGAGENGCILHYMENTKAKIGNNLLLMDVGAEYHGYTADVTRTVPARGKFSSDEKEIYQLVYDAQEAAFKILKDGAKFSEASNAAKEVIANGLLK